MPVVPTIEIHSPKDARQKWIINYDDYKPGEHRRWGEPTLPMVTDSEARKPPQPTLGYADTIPKDDPSWVGSTQRAGEVVTHDEPDWLDSAGRQLSAYTSPPVSDFVSDSQGNVTHVMIVNPEDRRARKEIPVADYDPDLHVLWSSRGSK